MKTQGTDEYKIMPAARRRALLDKLKDCHEQAQDGDEETLSKVREIFKEAPGLARIFLDLAYIS